MTIDFHSGLYFHAEGPGLLVGMSDPDERPGFATDTHDRWIPGLCAAMERRAPALLDLRRTGGWAGLYEITPDHNALIGEATSVSVCTPPGSRATASCKGRPSAKSSATCIWAANPSWTSARSAPAGSRPTHRVRRSTWYDRGVGPSR
ncbi:hypothetical protein SALBM311S_03942 [Streptomyces alboniger]